MNTKNNSRKRDTLKRIEAAFERQLLQNPINRISVTEICKEAGINRTTFYANYVDIYDLGDKIRQSLEKEVETVFCDIRNHNAETLFKIIHENQNLFKIYFRLGFDREHPNDIYDVARAEKDFGGKYVNYHIEFFKSGLNAIIKLWLENGCRETPAEMAEILKAEYIRR